MADDVKLTFTGNSADAEKAIAQLERKYDALEQKIKRSGAVSKKVADESAMSFAKMGQAITSSASALTGISGPADVASAAWRVATNEVNTYLERTKRAASASATYAQTLEQLYINAVGDPSFPDLATADKTVKNISGKTGVEPKDVAAALNVGIATKGNLPAGADVEMVDKVLSLIPLSTGSHEGMVTGGLGLQKAIPGTSSEEGLGFLLRAAGTSHVASNEEFVKNAVPAILGGIATDETKDARGSAAIYNTITQLSGDVHGRRSRTAVLGFEAQAKEFLKEEPQLKSHMDRVKFLQDNPDAAKIFMHGGEYKGRKRSQEMTVTGPDGEEYTVGGKKYTGERQMTPFIEELLLGANGKKMLQDIYAKTPVLADSEAYYQQAAKELSANPNVQVARSEKLIDARTRQFQLDNQRDAQFGVADQGLTKGLADSGLGWADQMAARGEFYARTGLGGQNPAEAAKAVVGGWAAQHELQASRWTGGAQGLEDVQSTAGRLRQLESDFGRQARNPAQPAPDDEMKQIARQQLEETKKLNSQMQEQNRQNRNRPPVRATASAESN